MKSITKFDIQYAHRFYGCPLCGIALVNGVCPKCGYRKPAKKVKK